MITKKEYPILEIDDNKIAVLNPGCFLEKMFNTNRLVITFFPEVIERLLDEKKIFLERTIPGENPLKVYQFVDDETLIILGRVGCPACAGDLDLLYAMGIDKVMFCGGGGVLDKDIDVGQLLVVEGAIRDEGFSYHYIEPSRYIYTNPETTEKITQFLDKSFVSYTKGIVWTTDALYRETPDKVALRKAEGAKIVEMEQAGCIAVSQFRDFEYGALIYGGDDVSQNKWDNRDWRSRKDIRYELVMLCKDIVKII